MKGWVGEEGSAEKKVVGGINDLPYKKYVLKCQSWPSSICHSLTSVLGGWVIFKLSVTSVLVGVRCVLPITSFLVRL